MAEKKTKTIKLQPKSRPSQTSCTGLKNVPWLNVSGVWLEQAGFRIGDRVQITIEQNQLIIKNNHDE
jgi:toxic protein SymE